MKQLIFDYYRRWGWVYVLLGLIHVVFCAVIVWSADPNSSFFPYVFSYVMSASAVLIYWDLNRGNARALTTLPISTKQIARGWWLACVGIPAGAMIALGPLSADLSVGVALINHSSAEFHFVSVLDICFINILWLGSMFFLLTGIISNSCSNNWWSRICGIFFGLLWGLSLGGGIFFAQYMNRSSGHVAIILAICGLIMSIAGWFRAERLVLQRAGLRLASQRSGKRPVKYKISKGLNGITLLTTSMFVRILMMGAFLIAVVALFAFFQGGLKSASNFIKFASDSPINISPLWMVIMFSIFPFFSQLRFLRTLPLSTIKLSILLVFLPVLSTLVIGAGFMGLVFSLENATRSFAVAGSFLLLSAGMSASIPILVWFGCSRQTFFGLFFIVGPGTAFLRILIVIPISYCALILALTVIVSCFLTKLALARSRDAYRSRPNLFGCAWNW